MIKREFKINLKSLIIWTSVVIALFLLVFAIYPSMTSKVDKSIMDNIVNIFPKEVLEVFNMDIVSIDSVFGWMQTEGLVFLLIIGSVYSGILGGTILLKEESDKTIEYLYSKPINKNKIVTPKIICGVINILLFTVFIAIFNFFGLFISNDLKVKSFLLMSFMPLLVFYAVFFINLFISTFFKKTKKSISVAIGFVFLSYFLQIIGGMSDKFEFIKYFSVFELISSRGILVNESIDFVRIGVGLVIISLAIAFTYKNYNKKELVI